MLPGTNYDHPQTESAAEPPCSRTSKRQKSLSSVKSISSGEKEIKDFFVITCPGLLPPEQQ